MSERRQAHRREPIEVELDSGDIFSAVPLPWMARNDFGNEIIRQVTASLNEAVRIYTDPELNIPQLERKLDERLIDMPAILSMGYPQVEADKFADLSWSEIVELIKAALDVNELSKLKRLIDPNSPSPDGSGGMITSSPGVEAIGQRIQSLIGSSSPEFEDETSSSLPTEKSSGSSENSKIESGTTEDGS